MNTKRIDKAYKHIAKKHPDITNRRHLELLTRKYLMRRKNVISGLCFFTGYFYCLIDSILFSSYKNSDSAIATLIIVLELVSVVLMIVGVCKFARALHDPLTPNEERELAARETIEKVTNANVDLSEFDNSAYIQYQQNKYNEASLFKKFIILIGRIPLLVKLIVVFSTSLGLIFSIVNINNIATYDKRNARAVTVNAAVSDITGVYTDTEKTKYKYEFEYSYNDQTYTFEKESDKKLAIGDLISVKIDPSFPANPIKKASKSDLIGCIIAFFIGIIIFIYSLFSVRKLDSSFSFASIAWLGFIAAAIGFAIWGISMLVSGSLWGLFIILIGCPILILSAHLFRKVFNS